MIANHEKNRLIIILNKELNCMFQKKEEDKRYVSHFILLFLFTLRAKENQLAKEYYLLWGKKKIGLKRNHLTDLVFNFWFTCLWHIFFISNRFSRAVENLKAQLEKETQEVIYFSLKAMIIMWNSFSYYYYNIISAVTPF